jgi:glycerol-1-phosphate dehydrogenase [NAD(P)+]
MLIPKQTAIPALVRVKPGALDRMGIYAERHEFARVLLFFSQDLDDRLIGRLTSSLRSHNIQILLQAPVESIGFEEVTKLFSQSPANADAIIGFGGGKALDVAKYIAFLCGRPYLSVPASLSNDGFCSSQSSLTFGDRRRPFPSAMPFGVIIDTAMCLDAPETLWHSGVGDLVSKFTAVTDWKMAFHATGTPVDDFAALLSDASVYQFLARPKRDLEGMTLLGSALLLNGISMSICGSSRPASGSEHLISHALDSVSNRPRLHGLQVGVATYLMSLLQGQNSKRIAALFDATGFWRAIATDPFDRAEWLEAARVAPSIKSDFYTVLSSRNCLPEIEAALHCDPNLQPCFR